MADAVEDYLSAEQHPIRADPSTYLSQLSSILSEPIHQGPIHREPIHCAGQRIGHSHRSHSCRSHSLVALTRRIHRSHSPVAFTGRIHRSHSPVASGPSREKCDGRAQRWASQEAGQRIGHSHHSHSSCSHSSRSHRIRVIRIAFASGPRARSRAEDRTFPTPDVHQRRTRINGR